MFGTGSANGPVPPNGESDQRQPDNSIVAACPTPKAPNTSKTCSTVPPAPFAGVSFAAHTVMVDRSGRALARLRCPAGTDGFCHGTLTLTAARGSARFGRMRFEIASSKTLTVPVKLSNTALRALRRHRKLDALATALAHDAAGTSKTTTSGLTLVSAKSPNRRGKPPSGAIASVRRTSLAQ
jgi:hypothetical protein